MEGAVHCMLVIVDGLNVTLVIELVVKLGVRHVVGLLMFVAGRLVVVRVVRLSVDGLMVSFRVANWVHVVRIHSVVVVGVLVCSSLTIDVMGGRNAIGMSLSVAVGVGVTSRDSVVNSMLVVVDGLNVTLVIVLVIERAVSRVVRRVVLIEVLAVVEVALVGVFVGVEELDDRHVDVLASHAVRLVYSGSAIKVLSDSNAILAVEELGNGDLIVVHEVIDSLAIEQHASNGGLHELSDGDIVGSEVLRDSSLVGGQELGDSDIEELSN